MWEALDAPPLWALLGALLTLVVKALVERWQHGRREDADVVARWTETQIEWIEAMQKQIGWLHIEMDKVWSDLQKCRALNKMYEGILDKQQRELADALADADEEGLG